METFLTIAGVVIVIVLFIGWYTCHNQANKAQQSFISRISQGDTELARLVEQNNLLGESTIQLKHKNTELQDWNKKVQSESKAIKDAKADLKEELRTTKGNFTRYKNRDHKKAIELKAHEVLLTRLGYKLTGTEHKLDDKQKSICVIHVNPIQPEESPAQPVQEKCNCMKPHQGIGGNCKNCRKPIK